MPMKHWKKIFVINLFFILSFIAYIFAFNHPKEKYKSVNENILNHNSRYKRIISLAPSITETLFALNLGERIVGVTRFCDYPSAVKKIPKIGGYFDINYEAILRLKPNLVITLVEHKEVRRFLHQHSIATVTVNHQTINGILNSILIIGKACNVEKRAKRLNASLNNAIKNITQKVASVYHPSVLLVLGRNMGTGKLDDAYIAAKGSFSDTLLELAGGINACSKGIVKFPKVTREAVIRMNPDYIIEMVTNLDKSLSEKLLIQQWSVMKHVTAIRDHHVFILSADYVAKPGPRVVLLLRDVAKTIHPEIKWNFKNE